MTCIVGLAVNGKTYIGGDSAGVGGYDLTIRRDAKVFTNGEFAMGFTTSFRMGQILQYSFTPPTIAHEDGDDLMAYMVRKFIPAVRSAFKDEGYAEIHANREHGGCFLVGVRGRLFQIDGDFQVGEHLNDMASVGCGHAYALGSLHAQMDRKASPETKLTNALEAAALFSAGVVGPFKIVVT